MFNLLINKIKNLTKVAEKEFVPNASPVLRHYDDNIAKYACDEFLKCKSFQELYDNYPKFYDINNIMFQYSMFESIYPMKEYFDKVIINISDNNSEEFYQNASMFCERCESYRMCVNEKDLKIVNLCLEHLYSICE